MGVNTGAGEIKDRVLVRRTWGANAKTKILSEARAGNRIGPVGLGVSESRGPSTLLAPFPPPFRDERRRPETGTREVVDDF